MASARQGFYWWEVDITYYALKVLSWFRLVQELRRVPEKILAEGQALDAASPSLCSGQSLDWLARFFLLFNSSLPPAPSSQTAPTAYWSSRQIPA